MNFCRRCGAPLENVKRHIYSCANGHEIFENNSPAVGVFIVTVDNKVLLAVRGREPQIGKLDAIGGYLDEKENFEEAAIREIKEEVALDPGDYEELRYLCSALGPYPYKGETYLNIVVFFWTRLKTDKPLIPADDVSEIRPTPLHDVDFDELHADDIRAGIKKLQQTLL